LPKEAADLVGKADVIFVSSTHGVDMDTNIRGGMPGFVRVVKNDEDGLELIYPECKSVKLDPSPKFRDAFLG
jgi:hypothetical protein